jgi:outer membrane protein assembly factor BamB
MMMKFYKLAALAVLGIFSTLSTHAAVSGWTNWRGPHQAGRSDATDLPKSIKLADALWTHDIAGRGHAVIADGRVYTWGYRGAGPDLQEVLLCLNEADGKMIWEHGYNDYLSDTVYSRYSVGAPTIDPATGWIYLMTTNGGVKCFNADGKIQWEYSLMERFGRLTFPNGRTGAAVIDGDLVIVRGVTSYWGKQGPARDRFYAFKKKTGAAVWASTPGVGPKDSSFSTPVLANVGARRVFYAGTGDGNVVCVDVRTGQPLWRFQLSQGGVNASVVVQDNILVAIHGKENIDSSGEGRMVGIKLPTQLPAPGEPQLILKDKDLKIADGKAWELWRLQHAMFTSSPAMADGRVYQVSKTGVLVCVDIKTGKELFAKKINNDQIHSSPLYADGHLYLGFPNGRFMVVKPGDDDAEIVSEVKLEGGILGSPVAWNGKIYLHTKTKLYCFGKASGQKPKATLPAAPIQIAAGKAVALQIIPGDVLLKPGQTIKLTVNTIDANGNVVKRGVSAKFAKYIPPTAKVKTSMNAGVSNNAITAEAKNVGSAGAWMATADGLKGILRGRILPKIPYTQDFESYKLTVEHKGDGVKFAYPPLAWTGARLKWEVRDLEGNKVFRKTLDRVLFQRAITIFGDPESSGYTIECDVMTDSARRGRSMGNIGVMNQRYFIALIGNQQKLEVSSNHERVKVSVPFKWSAKKWYTLKTRVDVAADGSGVVRAKAWPQGGPEPAAWTLEVKHKNAHKKGAPGIIGFSPQSLKAVFIDNIKITWNQ